MDPTDTPLARWYTSIRSQRLVDGPDEVHRWTVGRNVIKAYKQFGNSVSVPVVEAIAKALAPRVIEVAKPARKRAKGAA